MVSSRGSRTQGCCGCGRRAMQQQTKDLTRQVVVLLGEVQRLKTGRIPPRSAADSPDGVQNAQAVISAHLVDVKDIQAGCLSLLQARSALVPDIALITLAGTPSVAA